MPESSFFNRSRNQFKIVNFIMSLIILFSYLIYLFLLFIIKYTFSLTNNRGMMLNHLKIPPIPKTTCSGSNNLLPNFCGAGKKTPVKRVEHIIAMPPKAP